MGRFFNTKEENRASSIQQYECLLYNTYYRDVFKTIYYISNDVELSKDLTNETFLQTFEKLHTLKEQEKFRQWITVIARNITVNYFRKFNKEILTEDIELYHKELVIDSVAEIIETRELRNEVNIILDQLEQRFKEVLILRYYHEFSYEEIQSKLGIGLNTVKSRLYRAKKKVYDMLKLAGEMNE